MRISTRLLRTLVAGSLTLGIGLAAVPAGAGPVGPTDEVAPEPCIHDCGVDPDPTGPTDLATPPADPGDPGGGTTTPDVPIPANATFTG